MISLAHYLTVAAIGVAYIGVRTAAVMKASLTGQTHVDLPFSGR